MSSHPWERARRFVDTVDDDANDPENLLDERQQELDRIADYAPNSAHFWRRAAASVSPDERPISPAGRPGTQTFTPQERAAQAHLYDPQARHENVIAVPADRRLRFRQLPPIQLDDHEDAAA